MATYKTIARGRDLEIGPSLKENEEGATLPRMTILYDKILVLPFFWGLRVSCVKLTNREGKDERKRILCNL